MDDPIKTVIDDCKQRMEKSVQALSDEFGSVRTGRASPVILYDLKVDYYGTPYDLQQLATITAPEPRLIVVSPWDKDMVDAIYKAITDSELGLNPINDGQVLRVPIPALTDERRHDMVRSINKMAEGGKVAARNVRRDSVDSLRKLEKQGGVSEDAIKRAQKTLDEAADQGVKGIEELRANKEKEVLEG